MEEFKGSTGPWVAHDDEESMATSVIMNDFGDILCVVGTYMTSAEEDFANADLIAAAPELLKALQDFMANSSGDEKSCGHSFECVCRFDKAKAAIAKALGK